MSTTDGSGAAAFAGGPEPLYRGRSSGAAVVQLQRRLNHQYPVGADLREDGEYGPATEAAVRAFQRRAGLLVDGIAGPATLEALGLVRP
jgi:peptidoglycan hydrolase-like protein with peptidoglycan-binding domain